MILWLFVCSVVLNFYWSVRCTPCVPCTIITVELHLRCHIHFVYAQMGWTHEFAKQLWIAYHKKARKEIYMRITCSLFINFPCRGVYRERVLIFSVHYSPCQHRLLFTIHSIHYAYIFNIIIIQDTEDGHRNSMSHWALVVACEMWNWIQW